MVAVSSSFLLIWRRRFGGIRCSGFSPRLRSDYPSESCWELLSQRLEWAETHLEREQTRRLARSFFGLRQTPQTQYKAGRRWDAPLWRRERDDWDQRDIY